MKHTGDKVEILIYTREPFEEYTESLSNSIHFAYSDGENGFQPLNGNYGILFAQGTIDEENVIHEKGLRNPYLFRTADGAFGIVAVRVDEKGNDDTDSRGQILMWISQDLVAFMDCGMVRLHDEAVVRRAVCEFNSADNRYEIHWEDMEGNFFVNCLEDLLQREFISKPEPAAAFEFVQPIVDLTRIKPGNILQVDGYTGKRIRESWTPVCHIGIQMPEIISAASFEQLNQLKATAIYSDGSSADKQIEWDCTGVDFSMPGIYTVKGKAIQQRFEFPLARGYADPVILPWNNRYYYIATNDNVEDVGIYVREAKTLDELFVPGVKEAVILDLDEEKGFIQTFWAPEFHWIGGELYILFAVGGKEWGPQCHMMKLKKGGDIMKAEDWETPVRVRQSNGAYLALEGITLDMTYFHVDGISCVVWSYRKGMGTPQDTGSMLYIATVDEKMPTMLTSEPVLLSRPLFGWENIQGTINNEGPYPLVTKDHVFISYSGGAACGYTYALGLLTIPRGRDFLNIGAWRKAGTPVLHYCSVDGVYGPGHNSFFRDYSGETMILYHGEETLVDFGIRCSAMHRVHFNDRGMPIFNMSRSRDLNPQLCDFTVKVIVPRSDEA